MDEERELDETREADYRGTSADVFAHGIGRGKLEETLYTLSLPFRVVDSLSSADVMLTTKQLYRRRTPAVRTAEENHVPVYVLRKNTPVQLEQALQAIAHSRGMAEDIESILEDTEESLQRVLAGDLDEIELRPQNAYIRRLQHQMAQEASLQSHSNGREPNRRVRVYRVQAKPSGPGANAAVGIFITFEGCDGAGKTTQAKLLVAKLEATHEVLPLNEPGGTPLGEFVHSFVRNHRVEITEESDVTQARFDVMSNVDARVDPIAELFLFEAARAQLVSEDHSTSAGQGPRRHLGSLCGLNSGIPGLWS